MPNRCHTTLRFSGPQSQIDAIAKTDLDFEKILPTPQDLLDGHIYDESGISEFQIQSNTAIHRVKDLYDWRLENWGVKWNRRLDKLDRIDPQTLTASIVTLMEVPVNRILKCYSRPPLSIIKLMEMPTGILMHISAENPDTLVAIVNTEEEGGFYASSANIRNGQLVREDLHEPSRDKRTERG